MYILDFDTWFNNIKEGIDTNIVSDDDDPKNEITIDDTTYTIKKNKVSINNVEIPDSKFKTDIKNVNGAIGDLKKTEERFEEVRLTGGENTKIAKDVINIINNEDIKYTKSNLSLFEENPDFFKSSSKGKIIYIQMPKLEELFNEDTAKEIKEIFKSSATGIGKGEYFLPLLYNDVYKKRPYGVDPHTGEREKGDNFILNGENKYNLELKSPDASLGFNSSEETYIKQKLKEIEKNNLNDIVEKDNIYKRAITSRFLKYAQSQAKSFDGNLYMCIFDDKNLPENILFINLSKIDNKDIKIDNDIKEELFETIYNLIDIDNIKNYTDSKRGKKDDIAYSFTFTYNGNTENPKLKCKLKSKLIKEKEQPIPILSRDNFTNKNTINKKEVN